MVDSVSTSTLSQIASDPATTTLSSDSSLSSFADDFDDFLTLLVTQLKNQDPTAPMDSNQFTQQIVQFSTVEQEINANKKLEQLVSIAQEGQSGNVVSYVGKDVEVKSDMVTYEEGSDVAFTYELKDEVEQAFITVYDTQDNTVFVGEGTTFAGQNSVSWDGVDKDGNQVEPGVYRIAVDTIDADGVRERQSTYVTGVVSAIDMSSDSPNLIVNTANVSMDDVLMVKNK